METITLIANTGIQLLTKRITFSSSIDKTLWFLEYFDGFNGSLNLKYLSDAINSNDVFPIRWGSPNCLAAKYFDHWIPVPFFENNQQNVRFKLGPSDWCRCKIIPDRQQLVDGSLTATMVLAFDTRSLFDQADDDSGCPVFNGERDKTYRFCNSILSTMDFCSGKNNRILEYLMEQAHGVCQWEDIPISHPKQHRLAFFASYLWLMDYIANNVDLPEVRLYGGRDQEAIPVEMDINIGDSQTSVRLSEDRELPNIFQITGSESLALQDFTDMVNSDGSLNKAKQPFDMRVAFQIADFGLNSLCSRQFVWPSMVRLGEEAQNLTIQAENREAGNAALSTFSNPQHFLWDDKAIKEEWQCVIGANGEKKWLYIDGISEWFRADGEIGDGRIDLFNPLEMGCHYSRKTLMTFAFMEMIAQTMAQINSNDYRMKRRHADRARIIDTVFVTCPAGMSKEEQRSMRKCLEDACFVLGQFYNFSNMAIAFRRIEIIQNKPPETNYFVLMNEKLDPSDTCIITPTQNCGKIVVDSFPLYIGYKEDESPSCLVKPFYVLDLNEKKIVEIAKQINWENRWIKMPDQNLDTLVEQFKDKLLSRFPLTITLYRPDFREDKEELTIDFVEDENSDEIPPNFIKLSVRSHETFIE